MSRPLLEVRELSHFYGSRLVFKKVGFCLDPGMAVLVAGENGAGKSTLLKCIAGLVTPAAGTVATHVGPHQLAYMGHATFVYPGMTAIQNLWFWNRMYGLGRDGAGLLGLLARVGLKPFAFEKARGFSRGMAQRLALARILLIDPKVILLDEPSTGLDDGSCDLLFKEIRAARDNGAGIMWVSHNLCRDLLQSDRVLYLKEKRVGFWGTSREYAERLEHVA
ncbi:ABC transporter ATP-binding protein [Desulfoplanes sp.]